MSKPADAFVISPDGSIRLTVRGTTVVLQVPTIGQLKKLEGARAQLLDDLAETTARLRELFDEQRDAMEAAAKDGTVAPQADPAAVVEGRELSQAQRDAFGAFWANVLIPDLAAGTPPTLTGDELPAFMGHGATIGKAFAAWESSPPDPGDG